MTETAVKRIQRQHKETIQAAHKEAMETAIAAMTEAYPRGHAMRVTYRGEPTRAVSVGRFDINEESGCFISVMVGEYQFPNWIPVSSIISDSWGEDD
jgi:hypothetical protein